jgi:hypothetical protein
MLPLEQIMVLGGIKDRIRKLIPNELADVAVKAAPFVAPFNPAVAGLMRGIGRFDQRGSISDAFKQGLLNLQLVVSCLEFRWSNRHHGWWFKGFTSVH